jgi:hypothetical protein
MRFPAALALALSVALSGCSSGGRQPLPPPGTPLPAPVELEEDPLARWPELLLLPGRAADLRYSPDALDRAAQVQRRLEEIAETLKAVAGEPVRLGALVLDREAWEKAQPGRVWGLPTHTGALVFALAAEGDDETVRRMRALTGGWLPPLAGEPFRGTAEEAASLAAADSLLQLEVATAFLEERHLRGEEPWVGALLAQLVARLAWERTDAGQVTAVADLFDRMALTAGRGRPLRLADYRRGLPLEEDLAFQAAFLRGADLLWVELGERGAARFLQRLLRAHLAVPRATLEKELPELGEWERRHFAPVSAPNP